MLKPKSSAIIIKTQKELKKIPNADWNGHGYPYSPLFYSYYRNGEHLYCTVIARDCEGRLRALPYKNGENDMRKKLKEKKVGT
jgi:hypothetical protein